MRLPTWQVIDLNAIEGICWMSWMEIGDNDLDCYSVGFFTMADEDTGDPVSVIIVDGEDAPKNWTFV